MKIYDLPLHKDTYFFGYGIDIEKPIEMANKIIKSKKENERLKADYDNKAQVERDLLLEENEKLKEDILFCLKSIKQEMEMSTDSRTKQEMLSCYQILSKWSDK